MGDAKNVRTCMGSWHARVWEWYGAWEDGSCHIIRRKRHLIAVGARNDKVGLAIFVRTVRQT